MPRLKKKSAEQKLREKRDRNRLTRMDVEVAEKMKDENTAARKKSRLDALVRRQEQAADTAARRSTRLNADVRRKEQESDAMARRLARIDPEVRQHEQEPNTRAHREKKKESMSSYENLMLQYQQKIKSSPSFICSSCGGLWYKESTITTSHEQLESRGCTGDFINAVLVVDQQIHRLCSTCKASVYKKKIPRMCLSNGFEFPKIPEELRDLSPLEERLVALRIPFMQIRLLGSERQSSLRGNVVNVENDLSITTQVLPRSFDETCTVQVQLMRRMRYIRPYMYETVRPLKVYKAAKYLLTTNMYQSENVLLSESWSRYKEGETINFICSDVSDLETQVDSNFKSQDQDATEEIEESLNLAADETLIYSERDTAGFYGVRIAPGEGKIPIPLNMDTKAEVLSFPSIFCGQDRIIKNGIKVSFTDIAKSELRRYDRRACIPPHILYAFKKSFNQKVIDAIQVCVRKRKGNTNVTASNALNPNFIANLMDHDEGYSIFKKLRSSPSYWQEKTKKVLGMIRQIGKPAFFITLSAAETKWPELLIMLYKILKRVDITEEDVAKLTYDQVAELIRSDPVTCMRNFDHRYRALLNTLFKPSAGLFSPYILEDHFARIEFQMRGSPHSHGLYWIKDAPTYLEGDAESERACIEFIDNFITCARDEDGDMSRVIGYQIHKHSHTCHKKSILVDKCRFGYPKPPMQETRILLPLATDVDPRLKKNATELYRRIDDVLSTMGRSCTDNIDYDEFLESLGTSHDEYILAVRSSIKRCTVFLKRNTSEIFINGYNKQLLLAWGANIDFQFVIDTYACAKYCVGYILKSDGGVSRLLRAATEDVRRGNVAIRDKLKKYASILINGTEISAQEACAFLLGIPNTTCSRSDIFINTAPPTERIGILKSKKDLQALANDSDDVWCKGLIDHYSQRPEQLDSECLAEFASMYDFSKSKAISSHETPHDDIEHEDSGTPCELETLELHDKSGFLRKRKTRKIIRYVHYSQSEDSDNFAREQLMLYYPWRNEEEELQLESCSQKANENMQLIMENSKPFVYDQNHDDHFLSTVFEEVEVDSNDPCDDDVLVTEEIQDLIRDGFYDIDVSSTSGTTGSRVQSFLPPKMIDTENYQKLMRSLNNKQRKFVLNTLHLLKTSRRPFYNFLSGGAGVGKSHVITAIVQCYMRYVGRIPSTSPEQVCVLVCAPTGKAAFNVFGMTLHSTFKLPPNQAAGKLCPLSDSAVNSLRCLMANTKIFIIDEVSMVSVQQLYFIDQRLQQIFGSREDFGGKSVLVVGHLRQLRPIGGGYVFQEPSKSTHPNVQCVGNHLWPQYSLYELDEIMRQKGEFEFCKALNNMSEGCMDEDDIALLKEREITPTNQPPPHAIHLFRTNPECQEHNARVYETLETDGAVSEALDSIEGKGTSAQKTTLLEYAKKLTTQQSDGLPYATRLQVGGEYFVTTNIDVQDGLFNGSTGALKLIEYSVTTNNRRVPNRAWVDFRNPLIGITKRAISKSYQIRKKINVKWVPIDRIKRNLSKGRHNGLQIIRNQVPLMGADGMTIDKSQGSSIIFVVLKVRPHNNRKLSREHLYVGCSRATSRNGLFLDGEFVAPERPSENDPVTLEMARLRDIPFSFAFKFLQDVGDDFQKMYFHNVQSFMAHHLDVCADQCCMSSDVIGFVEPHLLESDNINFPDFECVHRTNCRETRNSEGSLIFAKSGAVQADAISITTSYGTAGHCLFVKWRFITGVTAIMTYKSPKFSPRLFEEKLEQLLGEVGGKIVVFGDVNINLATSDGRQLKELFEKYNLETKLRLEKPTTDGGTHIDCCFSNVAEMEAWIYESYYSYHKPICMIWPKDLP